jgi:hypothetical protein
MPKQDEILPTHDLDLRCTCLRFKTITVRTMNTIKRKPESRKGISDVRLEPLHVSRQDEDSPLQHITYVSQVASCPAWKLSRSMFRCLTRMLRFRC